MSSLGGALGAMVSLTAPRVFAPRKLLLPCIAPLVVLIATLVARSAAHPEPDALYAGVFDDGFMTLLALLVPYAFAASAVSDELEDRTFAYVATRPHGRVAMALVRIGLGALASALILAFGALALWAAAYAGTEQAGETFEGALLDAGGLALLSFALTPICYAWGALAPSWRGLAGAMYLAVVEFFGSLTYVFRVFSARAWAMALIGHEVGGVGDNPLQGVSRWTAALVLVGVAVAWTALSVALVRYREFGARA
jgi:hypothetical protein